MVILHELLREFVHVVCLMHGLKCNNYSFIVIKHVIYYADWDRAQVSDVYSDENFFFYLWTDYVKTLIKIGLRTVLRS